ncbi:MAG TPA: BlaI/MecI/CopY family transcriptional regulator [Polyangia bacterium]|nr:BlaI/MecI/CopY family transcriptional regulator [Polyangia bacterium]
MRVGDVQLRILRELWQRGEATVADIHAALYRESGVAFTTVATMLKKMERKGIVTHRVEERRHIYRPTVSERALKRSMVADLTARLFDGDASALVSHLLAEHDIDRDDVAAIRKLLAARHRKERGR